MESQVKVTKCVSQYFWFIIVSVRVCISTIDNDYICQSKFNVKITDTICCVFVDVILVVINNLRILTNVLYFSTFKIRILLVDIWCCFYNEPASQPLLVFRYFSNRKEIFKIQPHFVYRRECIKA